MSARAPTGTAARRGSAERGGRDESQTLPGRSPTPQPPAPRPATSAGGRLLGVLLESVVALLAVALFLSVLLGWFGRSPHPPSGAAAPAAAGRPLAVDPESVVTGSAREAARDLGRPAAVSSGRATGGRGARVPAVPVAVLNATHVEGLAARTAERLRARGWRVPVIDDFAGEVRATTVYFPTGRSRPARMLADQLGVDRVRPAPTTIAGQRLVLVLDARLR